MNMNSILNDILNRGEMIKLDTDFAKEIGFTSDKFNGYLWRYPDCIYISVITSIHEGQGNLSELFDEIWKKGLVIKVPTPFDRMKSILIYKGFHQTWEYSEEFKDNVEIWVKESECPKSCS